MGQPGSESSRAHWDHVYGKAQADELSWFQRHAGVSLAAIDRTAVGPHAAILDVGGGASTLVDGLLARGFDDVTVLDLSETALATARDRLGAPRSVRWVCADVLSWRPDRPYDVWHDRALFHFLVEPADRARYLDVLRSATPIGGYVVLGTFAADGPKRCSGLPVRGYSPQDLVAALGADFDTVDVSREEHHTPSGLMQPFSWVVACRR